MRFVRFEVRPCMNDGEPVDGRQHVTVCEPEEAEFWTVYGRYPDGTAQAIADLDTERAAKIMLACLNYVYDCNQEFLAELEKWEAECYPDDEDKFECGGLEVTEAILKAVNWEADPE